LPSFQIPAINFSVRGRDKLLQEGWNLAKRLRDAIQAIERAKSEQSWPSSMCRAKPMPREELLGIFCRGGGGGCCVSARLAGHPGISCSPAGLHPGGYLTPGVASNRLLAFNDPGVILLRRKRRLHSSPDARWKNSINWPRR
jgi:hypothetical protein